MSVSQNLTLTESKVDNATNSSEVTIKWTSTQSGDSWNGYTRTAYYYVSINGEAETKYSVSYVLPQSTTATIVNTTITVPHRNDGTATIAVRTWMDTSISAGVVELNKSLTLTTIPRASTISYANTNVRLGGKITVRWVPLSTSHYYMLRFSFRGATLSTKVLRQNYTLDLSRIGDEVYNAWTIPISWASQFGSTEKSTGLKREGKVTLYTYSDSAGTVQIGSESSATFSVDLDEKAETKPSLTMNLSPVTDSEGFESMYIQGESKVQATFSGSGKYGATIKSYNLSVEGKTYSDPYTSSILVTPGVVSVVGVVTDSRGFTNSVTQEITVHEYSPPSVVRSQGWSGIVCRRCLSDGTLDNGGTYLLMNMGRRYTTLTIDGVQKNFCKLSYRYKTDGAESYSDPKTLLAKDADTDYVNVILPNIVTSQTTAYNIQLIAEDNVGATDVVTIIVPTMFVTLHIPEGGHGLTLGGYHDPNKHDTFDCKFNAEFHGTVSGSVYGLLGSSGEIHAYGDLNDYRTPGVYAVTNSSTAGTIKNMPNLINPTDGKIYHLAGLLRVFASIGQTYVTEGAWKYVTQEYRALTAEIPDYRRVLSSDGDGTWHSGEWVSALGT